MHVLELTSELLDEKSTVWSVELEGERVATSIRADEAISLASKVLNCSIVTTPDGLEFDGPYESKPERSIDFERAKILVTAKMLWLAEHDRRTPVEVVDQDCVEYEWGWVMHWQPTKPYSDTARKIDQYNFPYLIDRATGNVGFSGGTKGLQYGIIKFLQKRPLELCGGYPYAPNEFWYSLLSEYERLGALEPLPKTG